MGGKRFFPSQKTSELEQPKKGKSSCVARAGLALGGILPEKFREKLGTPEEKDKRLSGGRQRGAGGGGCWALTFPPGWGE